MRIVASLGGNALARRGEPMTVASQRECARCAAHAVAEIADGASLVVTHGSAPQLGWLRAQARARGDAVPLDVLGAESEGLLGYLLDQELSIALPERQVVALLTRVVVDPAEPAAPLALLELPAIELLVAHDVVVVCVGGGGVPVALDPDGGLRGIEGVVDDDAASALLARELGADVLLLLTDVEAVYEDWPERRRPLRRIAASELARRRFDPGTMGSKVAAACAFARTGRPAAIGALDDAAAVLRGEAGTIVTPG